MTSRTTAIFDCNSGAIVKLLFRGVDVLAPMPRGIPAGPQLTCIRAYTDNDRWMSFGGSWSTDWKVAYLASGLTQLHHHSGRFEITNNIVKVTVDVTGAKGCGYLHTCSYIFNADGTLTLDNDVKPYGTMPPALPRLGLTMRLAPRFENLRYYGRGPWENYIDRCTGSFIGLYESTVTDQFVDYVRPQDNGAKTDVRWAEFTDDAGIGVRVSASVPFFLQALHYSWEDLEFSRFCDGQRRFRSPLVARPETILNVDVRQTGLGGASCGPATMNKYRFDPRAPVRWKMTLGLCKKQ